MKKATEQFSSRKRVDVPWGVLGRSVGSGLRLAIAVLGITSGLTACSDDGDGGEAPSDTVESYESTGYAIKFYRAQDEAFQLAEVGPASAVVPPIESGSAPSSQDAQNVQTRRDAVRIEHHPDGDDEVTAEILEGYWTENYTVDQYTYGYQAFGNAWELVTEAAAQCERENNRPAVNVTRDDDDPRDQSLLWGARQITLTPPVIKKRWFIYSSSATDSCDAMLQTEENLLCVADKLAEIADTVRPLKWDDGKVVIPPQSTRDKFIVRELAINALAHLARLDRLGPPNSTGLWGWNGDGSGKPGEVGSCTYAYKSAICSGCGLNLEDGVQSLFGVPLGGSVDYLTLAPEGVTVSEANLPKLINPRLALKAHILRAAGRLLRDLVEKSVEADLAGAEKARAQGGNTTDGARSAWGVDQATTGAYNTLRHALRVLYGRWELATGAEPPEVPASLQAFIPSMFDRQCNGFAAAGKDDLVSALGPGFSARWEDVAAATAQQALAVNLIARAGIVLPSGKLKAASEAQLRAAVVDQLQRDSASLQGIDLADDDAYAEFIAGPGQTLKRIVDGVSEQDVNRISEQDLRFGLQRALVTYRLLVDEDDLNTDTLSDFRDDWAKSGIYASNVVTGDLEGVALKGGIPAGMLSRDAMASVGRAAAASQCHEVLPYPGNVVTQEPKVYNYYTEAFQDAFSLGALLKRQFEEAAGTPESDEIVRLGRSEFAGFADATLVSEVHAAPGETTVEVQVPKKFLLRQLGVSSVADVSSRLTLVFGKAWQAECEAGIRKGCADLPTSVASRNPAATTSDSTVRVTFAIHHSAVAAGVGGTSFPTEGRALYLVTKGGAEPGQVLGVFNSKQGRYLYEVSDLRRELTNRLFGLGRAAGPSDACDDFSSIGTSTGYCVSGVSRDAFVPLANELTSESGGAIEDSWKHYLSLAKEAAAEADELGRQMIDIGLQRDLRREQAQEEIAGICGTNAAAPDLEVDGEGNLSGSKSDEDLDACVNEPEVDVVFFSGSTSYDTSDDTELNSLRTVLRDHFCDGSTTGVCASDAKPTNANLGFAPVGGDSPGNQEKTTGNECELLVKPIAASFVAGNFDKGLFSQILLSDSLDSTKLLVNLGRFRLEEGEDGVTWTLTYAKGGTVMKNVPIVVGQDQPEELGDYALYPTCKNVPSGWACRLTDSCCNAAAHGVDQFMGTVGQATVDANLIRRRVESGLWHMGAVAGRLPAGVFNVPIPIRPFTGEPGQDETLIPAPVVYGGNRYAPDGSDVDGPRFKLWMHSETRNGDIHALGVVRPMTEGFRNSRLGTWTSPDWRAELLQDQTWSGYTVRANNTEVVFSTADAGALMTTAQWLAHYAMDGDYPEVVASPAQVGCQVAKVAFISGGAFSANVGSYESDRAPVTLNDFVPEHESRAGSDYAYFAPGCAQGMNVDEECVGLVQPNAWSSDSHGKQRRYARDVLAPTWCGPDKRANLFLDIPGDPATGLTTMAGLACLMEEAKGLPVLVAPKIDSVEDIALLKRWLSAQAEEFATAQDGMFVVGVPRRVVEYFQTDKVPFGAVGEGARGTQILELAKGLQGVSDSFATIASGFRRMASAIDAAELGLEAADIRNQMALQQLAFQKLEVTRQLALAAISLTFGATQGVVSSVRSGGGSAPESAEDLAGSAVNFGTALAQQDNLEGQGVLAGLEHGNVVASTMQALDEQMGEATEIINQGTSQLKTATLSVLQQQNAIRQSEDEARYQAAKAAGGDFVLDENGEPLAALSVNTVYRRDYDITRRRYESALQSAKQYAYLARLAIEQRLGVRMNSLNESIGPIEPPASWADDVCSMQGVNYEALRSANPESGQIDGGSDFAEADIVEGFADQYIGDYVDKLQQFVEFYNVQYPFRESDDVAVLSLRDDLLYGDHVCSVESRNLLYYSDQLFSRPPLEFGALNADLPNESTTGSSGGVADAIGGWRSTDCRADGCVHVSEGRYTVASTGTIVEIPPPIPGGVSVIEVALPPEGVGTEELDSVLERAAVVYQSVQLEGSRSYRASWWDMALGIGGIPTSADQPFRVAVYDKDWLPIALSSFTAQPGGSNDDAWEQRVLDFSVHESGVYHLAFSPTDGPYGEGSIAVSNVTLLDATATGDASYGYEQTGSTRQIARADCGPGDAALMRKAFKKRCDERGCYYELRKPFLLRDSELAAGTTDLPGIAEGNYNYRHVGLALNMVGTGLIDCADQTAGCYSNGFIEYDLDHGAFEAEIEDYGGDRRCFSFGSAQVRHAKALATERVLGVPLSSADRELISAPEFLKPTLHGRPLSGTYKLRIHDFPGFQWDKVEDIQILMQHRYWSRVERIPGK